MRYAWQSRPSEHTVDGSLPPSYRDCLPETNDALVAIYLEARQSSGRTEVACVPLAHDACNPEQARADLEAALVGRHQIDLVADLAAAKEEPDDAAPPGEVCSVGDGQCPRGARKGPKEIKGTVVAAKEENVADRRGS